MNEDDKLLETQIDRDNRAAEDYKKIREQQQLKKEVTSQIKKSREHYSSTRSELITYCKLLCMYFNHLNQNRAKFKKMDEFQIVEKLMEEFCEENNLLLKSMKEIHYLCIQLEKMLREDIVKAPALMKL